MHKQFQIQFEEYDSAEGLPKEDAALLDLARNVTKDAYAPYSRFRVGAAARLSNGQIVTGTNQENASFPAGICAERTLLSVAASLCPGVPIESLAVSYDSERGASDRPISPCGICRQSLQEFEQRTGRSMRIILAGQSGKVLVLEGSATLLPFAFSSDELR
ncbi:MAG TPA: cytidine deaminase [Puia sp.]|uniref:cytidine deaminase n=1 Tax=Puia sp. TaxID=2045100 RepID=UPI002C9D229A|nr:cytidine deaminase [Puia sp.]HVU95558.1 cytidine deaminase [Puia sp.]